MTAAEWLERRLEAARLHERICLSADGALAAEAACAAAEDLEAAAARVCADGLVAAGPGTPEAARVRYLADEVSACACACRARRAEFRVRAARAARRAAP